MSCKEQASLVNTAPEPPLTELKLLEYVIKLLPLAWRDHKYSEEQELLEEIEKAIDVESGTVAVLLRQQPKMQRQFWLLGHLINTEEAGWEDKIFGIIENETNMPNSLKSIAIKLTGELGYAVQSYDSKE